MRTIDPERSVMTDCYRVAERTMAMSKPAIRLPIKLIERVPVQPWRTSCTNTKLVLVTSSPLSSRQPLHSGKFIFFKNVLYRGSPSSALKGTSPLMWLRLRSFCS